MQHQEFIQPAPVLADPLQDNLLEGVFRFYGIYGHELIDFSLRVVSKELLAHAQEAERNQPTVDHYDTFGKRVDNLHTSSGWKFMKRFAAENALVAGPYVDLGNPKARLLQFAKIMLWVPHSALFTCPLAMTDGAAKVLSQLPQHQECYHALTSKDPESFATSGQWMTERPGGSDLSNSETIANQVHGPDYLLDGFKWFSSATDADMSLALARTVSGLSLFLVDLKKAGPTIQIVRLKKKHGTHPLPTAELRLSQAPGVLIGQEGKGVKNISPLLNITRIHNSVASLGYFSRAYQVLAAYSAVRMVGTKRLIELPLHQRTLARLQLTRLGLTHLTFFAIYLLGKEEARQASPTEVLLLRAITPLTKAYVAKLSYEATQECCEGLGGMGYIENENIQLNVSRMLRDSLVLTIWEGTSNVLAHDFWRVLKSSQVQQAFRTTFPGLDVAMPPEADYREAMFAVAHQIVASLLDKAGQSRFVAVWRSGKLDQETDRLLVSFPLSSTLSSKL
ncbi:hypothetical protein HDV03_001660 [Kappamyces sp. JEL0829]|nr:hypothetical protein HDV03_001660 [Kappamyces sp. JEL0829]